MIEIKLIGIVVLLFCSVNLFSQKYDLIETKEGKRIICRIDSVSESFIYYKIKYDSVWVSTFSTIDTLVNYDYCVIEEDETKIEDGIYLLAEKKPNLRNNSVYLGNLGIAPMVHYDRFFRVYHNVGVVPGIGAFRLPYHNFYDVSGSVMIGIAGERHFVEASCLYYEVHYHRNGRSFQKEKGVIPRIGYRYKGKNGLLFRIGFGGDEYLGIGYSF